MLVSIVKIGNSRGIRIPKPLLEQAGIADAAELTIEAGRLVIAPAQNATAAKNKYWISSEDKSFQGSIGLGVRLQNDD